MRKIKHFFVLLLAAVSIGQVWGATYKKVTKQLEDWSGTYLIVCEDLNLICQAGVDANPNYVDVTISDEKTITDDDLESSYEQYAVEITPYTGGEYCMRALGGTNKDKYLQGIGSSKNGTDFVETASKSTTFTVVFKENEEGADVFDYIDVVNNGNRFAYNTTNGEKRWRFFKPGSPSQDGFYRPCLYKKDEGPKTSTTVADLAGLQAALASEVDTVFVSQTISVTNGTTIDAKGKVISVLKPYMAETGMIAVGSSNYTALNIAGSVSIANATILGGSGSDGSSAGGINVNSGAQLTMENITIARSYRGIYVRGTVIMKNCDIVRNVCNYGGGILLAGGSKLIMDGCSLSENRSLSGSGGGGAMEIQSSAVLYANNTVIANNSSSEIGGAINLYRGTAYLTNCTISGNTNQTGYGARCGAGIGNNGGTMYAANCIFMNNTFFAPNTEEPTISDIGLYSGNNLTMINCIYGGVVGGTPAVVTNCKVATKSDAVFAGYRGDGVFRLTNAQTPGYKHSILTRKVGGTFFSLYAPAGQFSGEGGIATYMDYSNINSIKMAYDNGGTITSLGGLSVEDLTEDNKVTTYYEPGTREVGVVGASAVDPRTYYTVKLIVNEHVSVKGVTVYGESYPEGTTVPISHTTDDGFYFHGWNLDMAGTPVFVNANPYNLVVNSDVNVYPQVALEGAYSIFVDLPNKDYVFDVTSGSKQPINQTGYAMNTSVTVKAERQWYVLTKWLDFNGTELSTDNPYTITMDADKSITPVWALDPNVVIVTVLDNTGGKVTGLAADGKYIKGNTVTLTATPNIGYELKEWQDGNGNQISTSNPLSFTVTQDTTLKPIYQAEQRSYVIATGVTAKMGTINKSLPWTKTTTKPGLAYMSATGHDGQDSRDTLIITPEEGISYRVKFDYAVSSEGCCDKMSIWSNGNIVANEIGGTASGTYDSRTAFLTESKPDTIILSYHKDGSVGSGDDRGYIYNIQVQVYDTPPTIYTVTMPDSEGGSVSGLAPQGKYLSGEEVSLTATALTGCAFKEWQDGNGNQISTSNPLSFTVTQDTTIKPIFEMPYVQVPGDISTDKLVLVAGGYSGINNEGSNIGSTHNGDKMYLYVNVDATQTQDYIFSFKSSNATYYDASLTISVTQNGSPITLDKTSDAVLRTGDWATYSNTHSFLLKDVAPGHCTICVQLNASWSNYAGNYKDFKVSPVLVYTRDVTNGSWGTICLPWESIALEGGDFYDVLGTKHAEYGVALVELDESDQLTAGKPYVFKATSEQIKVTYNPITAVDDSVDAGNHIIGSFAGCPVPNGMYIIYNNLLYITDGSSTIGANRAYFDVASMGTYNPATAPARVVFMGGRQTPTGFGQWNKEQGQRIMKVVENGQFIIIKDNKMYNAQGIEIQ